MAAKYSAAFAQWLGDTHPELYEALFAHAVRTGVGSRPKQGLGSLGDVASDFGLSDFTPEMDDIQIDQGNLDYVMASAYGDAVDALPGDLTNLNAPAQRAPVSSTQGVTGSTNSVGSWLTSGQGLTAITQLGTAVLGAVATTQVAKTQMAIIQAQAQRVQAGQSPQPITYVTGANGQPVPVYVQSAGQQMPSSLANAIQNGSSYPVTLPNGQTGYTLNNSTLSSLFSSPMTMALLLGGGLLLLLAAGKSS